MPIEFRCDCGSRLRVPDQRAGQVVRCPACEEQTLVPKLGEDPDAYSVDGKSPRSNDLVSVRMDTSQRSSRKRTKSTYRAARSSEPPTSKASPSAWRSASREKRRSQPPWLASFQFPFQDENKFTLLGWGIGFAFVAIMMSIPIPSLVANIARLFVLLIAAGYFFHFLSEVVRVAAGGDVELPETSSGEDVLQDAVTWCGAIVLGLSPWWGFHLLRWWFAWETPAEVGEILLLVGAFYSPMALLAATLFNSVLAANPLYVFGAIFKLPRQYLTCCLLSASVLVVYFLLGAVIMSMLGPDSLLMILFVHTISALLLLYVSIVVMHQLGTVYYKNRAKIGWFRD
ncbi:hypothetical protein [Symmachiella dynata]|uniref:hypothetical protein n=1 Tax=Symmachiella dynata TaxID=2527995 RepID=UPI0030ED59B0